MRRLAYSFWDSVNYGHAGSMVMLELRLLHLAGNRKPTDCHTEWSLRKRPQSSPPQWHTSREGVAQNKDVPSSLLVRIKGLCHPTFSNKTILPSTRSHLLIVPLFMSLWAPATFTPPHLVRWDKVRAVCRQLNSKRVKPGVRRNCYEVRLDDAVTMRAGRAEDRRHW